MVAREANREIVVGHTAFKAASRLSELWKAEKVDPKKKERWHDEAIRTAETGMVPVRFKEMTARDAHLLAAADNRLNEFAGWDNGLLLELLGEYQDPEKLLAGWDSKEIDRLVASVSGMSDTGVPKPPSKPKTKPGDLIMLGRHRLLCGDSTELKDVERLLGGDKPAIMNTDPPYGVSYSAGWREIISHAPGRRMGKVSGDAWFDWREAYALAPCSVTYVWHADIYSPEVAAGLVSCGFELRNLIIWSKPHFPIGRSHYHHRCEFCWYATKGDAGWIGDRRQTTVWEVALDENLGGDEGGHSTQKPVELAAIPIRNHSGDVYEPFAGTGSTLAAAEQLGRRCYAMELDPGYCDVITARWEKLTGKKAKR